MNTICDNKLHREALSICLIAALGIIAYWPVSFHIFSLKNDAINFFLPVRWQISEAISNGHYPFWSPWLNLGYPLHGDMQSGAWNPFVWIFSLFGPYTLYTLQLETILYVVLSGCGMYGLLKYFHIGRHANLMCSVAYMLSGFNIDSSQFLVWVAGAAFLPFIVLFFHKTLKEKTIRNAILTGFFFFLMFVCAYPAYFILTFYLCIGIFILYVKNRPSFFVEIKRSLPLLFVSLIIFFLLSLPSILSYVQFVKYSYRGSGTSYSDAMSNPYHPFFLISLLFPWAVFNSPYTSITNPLGRDMYFGIITLIFTIVALFNKSNNHWVKYSKWGLAVSFIFSLGDWALLRPISYYLLPLMDTFRHPSGARLFTIFFSCMLGAWAVDQCFAHDKYRKGLEKVLIIVLIFFAGILSWSLIMERSTFSAANTNSISNLFKSLRFHQWLLLNAFFQAPFIALFFIYGIRNHNTKRVAYISIINSVLIAAVLMPMPVVKKDSAAYIQSILQKEMVKGYPLPDLKKTLNENSTKESELFDAIGPLGMYTKRVGRNDYYITPSNLLSQRTFWADTTIRKKVMSRSVIYGSEDIIIKPLLFTPNRFSFNIYAGDNGTVTLNQNYYPNWQLVIDGKKTMYRRADISFMRFDVSKGNHLVEFLYRPVAIIISLWASGIILACLIGYFGFISFRKTVLSFNSGSSRANK
jgi:hypothetical protein